MNIQTSTPVLTAQNELRRTFIAMLFALVAATLAQQIADLLEVITGGWTTSTSISGILNNLAHDGGLLFAPLAHSILALLMVSMSWVMWSKSQAAGNITGIKSIWSWGFLLLLIEVFLVVLYFAIAKSVEQNIFQYKEQLTIEAFVLPPSARPEAIQLMCVFFVFAIWDLIADVIKSPREHAPSGYIGRGSAFLQGALTYCSISILCALGAWLVSDVSLNSTSPIRAVFGDLALICLLMLFRIGKRLEYYWILVFPKEGTRSNTKRSDKPSIGSIFSIGLLFIIFFSLLIASRTWPPCFLES